MDTQQKTAFVGLGNMGLPMAANLLKKGFDLIVFDLKAAAVAELAQAGAKAAACLADMTDADTVITMLPTGAHVKSVLLGEQGLFAGLKPGSLVIDCSTISPEDAETLASEAVQRGIRLLDAPVSGGIAGAAKGTLSFIVGGGKADCEAAKPILKAMGNNIFHAGGNGAGLTAKICNNMLLGVLMNATSEALALGVKNGLDPKTLSDIMAASSGGNWVLNAYNPYPGVMENAPASHGYRNGFMVELMLKDLLLAQKLAIQTGLETPLGGLACRRYQEFDGKYGGVWDFSAVLGLYLEEVLRQDGLSIDKGLLAALRSKA